MIHVTLDGRDVNSLDLDDARTLAEAVEMAVAAITASIADAAPRRRTVAVRWHDGRRASRTITA